jgi:peptidoglycan/xylan/chitin deacetylase (PgdA/CDA1 family)
MKHIAILVCALLFLLSLKTGLCERVIRVNQLGYLPEAAKTAVFLSDETVAVEKFVVCSSLSGEPLFEAKAVPANGAMWGKQSAYRLDFSGLKKPGGYYIAVGTVRSPSFRIADDVYRGTADFILNYMRQQRCGYNPFLRDSCHVHDGIIVDHPERSGAKIDVTGGWHDASDYLQYVTTSANATYQMLFAYRHNPAVYGDNYKANGLPGGNGVPDILDEARWGLEWLLKMNPAKNEMYNQIADDRDHRGFRLPTQDTASYGLGESRPVYFVTGKPQGLSHHKNRSTGVASTAAKYASAFALGAQIFEPYDPVLATKLKGKAKDAWDFALSDPGVCQTACVVSPYFYEEGNYVDDMELAAASLFNLSGDLYFEKQADYWGELEPVTPWMELHRARHYQYYPFINLGHFLQIESGDSRIAGEYLQFAKQGLEDLRKFAADDPFQIGVPFVWCSNNFVVAAATQARLYRQLSGDDSFAEMEAALIDWLFGCNPWGTSMICGLPAGGDSPVSPHSAITLLMNQTTTGGLVDGPVYRTIFESLRGIRLMAPDVYANYQGGKAVYHDDIGDYSSNEPTMDGTASLSFLLSSLEKKALAGGGESHFVKDREGALVRMDTTQRKIYLLFSAHDSNDGGEPIYKTLKKYGVQASFFFTGSFYANAGNQKLIRELIHAGHYLGAHSDNHLLYAGWDKRDSLLVSRDEFESDLKANYQKMAAAGVDIASANYFLPPFEWYNQAVVDWAHQLGLTLINFTPGVKTNADYTTPDIKNYTTSEAIADDLKQFEKRDPNGLNGSLILIHLGVNERRPDKFYNRLGELIEFFRSRGYEPERL